MDWITIIILLTITGCIIKTTDIKKRISAIFLIIIILFIEWFIK